MAQDLPSFLDLIKRRKPEDFVIVSHEVDPKFEITGPQPVRAHSYFVPPKD